MIGDGNLKKLPLYKATMKSRFGVKAEWKSADLELLEDAIAKEELRGSTVITGFGKARIEKMPGLFLVEPHLVYVDII